MDARNLSHFEALAHDFAAELSDTVRSVAGPDCSRFAATIAANDGAQQFEAAIRQAEGTGILLTAAGKPVLRMEVRYWVTQDTHRQYLRVKKSQFRILPPEDVPDSNLPVFRYEYDNRQEQGDKPAAHLQVHGSHPSLQKMIEDSRGPRVPDISRLHFPVGGTRFRPCLEDVLEALIHEFGIDPIPDKGTALAALRRGREIWRATQLRAIVRDDLDAAAEVLKRYGYEVTPPGPDHDPPPPERNSRTFERL